jgi:hypothetical protein
LIDMLTAQSAISRFRRDLTVGALLRLVLAAGAVCALGLNLAPNGKIDGTLPLLGIGFLWVMLSYRSIKGNRLAAESPSLIATGQLDAAEEHIELALRSFSLFRSGKMLSLHHLALLRHAQRQWRDSAMISQALLRQRFAGPSFITKPSQLLLADALLELGDLQGAYRSLALLSRQRLTLAEAMNFLLLQLDYESRLGAWNAMVTPGMMYQRLQLIELMPTANAARAQALLSLAALKTGRTDWAQWLRSRAELLVDAKELVAERPYLSELWPSPVS